MSQTPSSENKTKVSDDEILDWVMLYWRENQPANDKPAKSTAVYKLCHGHFESRTVITQQRYEKIRKRAAVIWIDVERRRQWFDKYDRRGESDDRDSEDDSLSNPDWEVDCPNTVESVGADVIYNYIISHDYHGPNTQSDGFLKRLALHFRIDYKSAAEIANIKAIMKRVWYNVDKEKKYRKTVKPKPLPSSDATDTNTASAEHSGSASAPANGFQMPTPDDDLNDDFPEVSGNANVEESNSRNANAVK